MFDQHTRGQSICCRQNANGNIVASLRILHTIHMYQKMLMLSDCAGCSTLLRRRAHGRCVMSPDKVNESRAHTRHETSLAWRPMSAHIATSKTAAAAAAASQQPSASAAAATARAKSEQEQTNSSSQQRQRRAIVVGLTSHTLPSDGVGV